jgi:hypothetical protein
LEHVVGKVHREVRRILKNSHVFCNNLRYCRLEKFRVFGSKCQIKREDGKMGNFDSRVDKGILVGYSSKRKAYKLFNIRLHQIVERINVTIDETHGCKIKEERKNLVE